MSSLTFWDALGPQLPEELAKHLTESNITPSTLDSLVRFLGGADHSPHLTSTPQRVWQDCQTRSKYALEQLVQPNGHLKRPRDEVLAENGSSKRPRQEDDDKALYTLHSVSTTSPIRKKLDISVTKQFITFKNPTTGALESTVPLASLKRAFILPTKGKSKPHWTVVLLASDTPSGKDSPGQQIIFGLDATTTAPFITTNDTTPTKHPKGTETYPLIYSFFEHLPPTVSVLEPEPAVFCSAATKGAEVAGIDAYRAAKPGTLWFFRQGILWGESKPCEFWAVEDLIGKSEGLRTLSATGRTCSVYLTRKGEEHGKEGEEEDLGDETEFSMVDGREQDPIHQWVRQHRHLFGRSKGAQDEPSSTAPDTIPVAAAVQGGKTTFNQLVLDEQDDEEDEDFAASSDDGSGSDSASPTSSSDEEDADADGSDEAEESGGEDDVQDADGDVDMELDPAHHPLMRPGAMKKMSKAAIDMVVGMMEDELAGGADSDEEDQLEE